MEVKVNENMVEGLFCKQMPEFYVPPAVDS